MENFLEWDTEWTARASANAQGRDRLRHEPFGSELRVELLRPNVDRRNLARGDANESGSANLNGDISFENRSGQSFHPGGHIGHYNLQYTVFTESFIDFLVF